MAAFHNLKDALTRELKLFHMNPDQPFLLRTDASGYAIGAVLEQDQNEKVVPVGFFSRKLTPGQPKWSPGEQETYAIISALRKWQDG